MLKNVRFFFVGLICAAGFAASGSVFAEEAAPAAVAAKPAPLMRCTPYLQSMSPTNVVVTWHTTRPAMSWVRYREAGSAEDFKTAIHSTVGLKDVGIIHAIPLEGLKPNTTYTYEVYSREVTKLMPYSFTFGEDANFKQMGNEDLHFTTFPDKGAQDFSFLVMNDLHDKNALHQSFLKNADVWSMDFVCYNGDIVPDSNQYEDVFKKFLTDTLSYSWQKPFFFLRGNHETRGNFARSMHSFFPTSTDQFFYTFSYGDTFFVNLDCGEDKVDTSKEYGGLVDFDYYRTKQVEWIKQVVKSPEYKKARYRIFFCHIPPVGGGDNNVVLDVMNQDGVYETKDTFQDPWHGDLEIRDKFLPLLLENKADLLISGHTHRFFDLNYRMGKKMMPAFINDNNSALRVNVNSKQITIEMFDKDGKLLHTKEIKARR